MGRMWRDYIYVNGAPVAVIVYPRFGRFFQRGRGTRGGFGGRSFRHLAGLRNARTRGGPRGELYYIHTDHLGTPRVITDPSTGQVVWRWDGEPFGASAPNEDPNGSGSNFVFNLRFPGQYYDSQTGLDYNYFRDYDPRTGRYVESDPIGLGGGLDTYEYVAGDPLNYTDFFGEVSDCGPGAIDCDSVAIQALRAMGARIPDALKAAAVAAAADTCRPGNKEHTKGKRKSTKGKHEKGRGRNKRDRGGEKGDVRRPYQR